MAGHSNWKQIKRKKGVAAMLIEALTDNENRTVSEIKQILRLKGGKFGAAGSVVYMFRHCGLVTIPKTKNAENNTLSRFPMNGWGRWGRI